MVRQKKIEVEGHTAYGGPGRIHLMTKEGLYSVDTLARFLVDNKSGVRLRVTMEVLDDSESSSGSG